MWQPAWTKTIELPVNYTLEDVYALGSQYTEQEIIDSGLGDLYKRAVVLYKETDKDPRQMRFWK